MTQQYAPSADLDYEWDEAPRPRPRPTRPPVGDGMAVVSLTLGLIALSLCWIPIVDYVSVVMGLLGFIFGVIALGRPGKVMAGFGAALSIIAVAVSVIIMILLVDAIGDLLDRLGVPLPDSWSTAERSDAVDGWVLGPVEDGGGFIMAAVENATDDPRSGTIALSVVGPDGHCYNRLEGAVPVVQAGDSAPVLFSFTGDWGMDGKPAGLTYTLKSAGC